MPSNHSTLVTASSGAWTIKINWIFKMGLDKMLDKIHFASAAFMSWTSFLVKAVIKMMMAKLAIFRLFGVCMNARLHGHSRTWTLKIMIGVFRLIFGATYKEFKTTFKMQFFSAHPNGSVSRKVSKDQYWRLLWLAQYSKRLLMESRIMNWL